MDVKKFMKETIWRKYITSSLLQTALSKRVLSSDSSFIATSKTQNEPTEKFESI